MIIEFIEDNAVFTPAGLFGGGDTGAFFDFTSAATLFSDTARTTLATVGGQVRGITDLSGTGRHLQTVSTTILRQQDTGVDYVDFPGAVEGFVGVDGPLNSSSGMFSIVSIRPTTPSVQGNVLDMEQPRSGQPKVGQTLLIGAPPNFIPFSSCWDNTSAVQDAAFNLSGTQFTSGVKATMASEKLASSIDIRLNGTVINTNSSITTPSAVNTLNGFAVGSGYAGTSSANFRQYLGRIYAVLFINRVLTSTEQSNLQTWFAAKGV